MMEARNSCCRLGRSAARQPIAGTSASTQAQRIRPALLFVRGMRCCFLARVFERFRQREPSPGEAELIHGFLRLLKGEGEILARPAGIDVALVVADLSPRLPETSPVRRH